MDLPNLPTQKKGKDSFTRKGSADQTALQRTTGPAKVQVRSRQLVLGFFFFFMLLSHQWENKLPKGGAGSYLCRSSPLYLPTGRGGPSKSLGGGAAGSAQSRPTPLPAPLVRDTPATTGYSSPCEATTSRAACATTARPRASSMPSPSSSRRRQRAARPARRWWTTRSSVAFERNQAAKEKRRTGEVRVRSFP